MRSSLIRLMSVVLLLFPAIAPAQAPVSYEGKTVLVTGSTDGLGRELAREFAAEGAHVIVHGRNAERGQALVDEINASGKGSARFIAADFASIQEVRDFAATVARDTPKLDLLVNNAGVLPSGERFGALDPRVLEHTLQVNTIAPLVLAQALAPLLARGRHPRVFNLSSRLGSMALTQSFQTPSYNISKAALNMATVLMARALNPMGIGVLAASPGWVRTDMGGDKAPVTAAESVRDMLEMLDRRAEPGAGEFVDRDGGPLPW